MSYFTLSAVINSDIKGIIFLALILINCIVTILVGNLMSGVFQQNESMNALCNTMNLSEGGPVSKVLPLNISILSFVFFYLVYIIGSNHMEETNVPTLILFPIFIIYQIYWSAKHECASAGQSFTSMVVGGGLGVGFSAAIERSGIPELQYFHGVKNQEICSKPSKTHFKCKRKGT
jgi:hypothetical protein